MTDALDIDDPDEVIAASARVAAACDAITGCVLDTVNSFVPHSSPTSPLDSALVTAVSTRILVPLVEAGSSLGVCSAATHPQVVLAAHAYRAADHAGAGLIEQAGTSI
ncbi:hypothetical protein [Nocardia tengchongensis]|uniref:hypothetical protein n=1 Tax=Nocardia tengchongensis TaxID=2055889 RepID=UPI003616C26D